VDFDEEAKYFIMHREPLFKVEGDSDEGSRKLEELEEQQSHELFL
jgi:hypothetical protein